MPVRHFYLLSHYICYSLFFLFSACWLQRNERNSLWENKGGERSEVYCLLGRYLCHGILFICSHITFPMVILFNFCLLAPEGMNAIVFEERRGRGQTVVAYSDIIFTLLNLFQVSLMIRWYRKLLLYIIILLLYCRNISFFSSGEISSEQVVDFWTLPFIFPKTIEFIHVEPKHRK